MWLVSDPVASWLIGGTVIVLVVSEALATYLGQARDGRRRGLGSFAESVLLIRRRTEGALVQDRSTKWILALGARVGLGAAVLIGAFLPGLRAYANTWWTLGLGLAVALAGIALRDWAVLSLGRYFRREVTIEPGQTLVRRGPYRWLRHPSYAGLFLVFAGLGLAFGSWVGAAVALATIVAATLPRIRVEERALARAFGPRYDEYAGSTARVLPHVW